MIRYAFRHTNDAQTVATRMAAYLPSNYAVVAVPNGVLITGTDVAGWTLDGYVLPRLASGMWGAVEIDRYRAVDVLFGDL